ncbi:Protein EXECUTER 2 like [Actinidia chinensis var. chinensis]|uniref:Protein EXECUTER 2 like n=1 Tax=Actinidia chinensis var. chinensis TaxID=1590841 RepID=A0A2R6QGQ5_ACTCC|nr:Protein EXECUTER 2 like [Actinidia chinensis var. chinensis]
MAVANMCGTGCSIPVPQLRPFSYSSSSSSSTFDCYLKKSVNVKFVLGRGCTATRNQFQKSRRISKLSCHCSANNGNNNNSPSDWEWSRWTRHFSEIEQTESFASVLKFQLEDAIEREDFQEAAKLKTAIADATSKDSVAEIMSQLKNAIDDERYHDASKLCRCTGSGLVGWWFSCSNDSDHPFGRLIRVTPGVGRFVGRSYSPRQLVTASPGTPLFEIFVVKDANKTYSMQVVFLHRAKGNLTNSTSLLLNSKPTKGTTTTEIKADKSEDKSTNDEGAIEEEIKSVLNFLKEKIPNLNLEAMNINVTKAVIEGGDSMNQLMQEDDENMPGEDSDDETSNLDDVQPDRVALGAGEGATEDGKSLDMKVLIGGILHNDEDTSTKDEYVRQPAEIEDMERDSFVLHIPARSQDRDSEESMVSEVKMAAMAAKGVSALMPPSVAKAFLSSDKVPSKVSRDLREIVKFAVSQAQKGDMLSEYTTFSRITTSEGDLDPFDGLYVGAFGPYGTEVVQLRRKYGYWNRKKDADKSSDVEFFEYVEATKLTGGLNVSAGEVMFRAKIGKGNRIATRGLYPDELGVVASYEGQGRIATRNRKWVDGELLQLNGKRMGPNVKGADLGFLYVLPKESFLVLFNRLKLPD